MEPVQRIEWYREWFERRGRGAFLAEFTFPTLVARENLETETEASFHTAFMSRSQFLAEMQKIPVGPDERPQIRAGEVRFVRKAAGAAFADRVGVGPDPVWAFEVHEQQPDAPVAGDVAHGEEHAVAVVAGEHDGRLVDHANEACGAAFVADGRVAVCVDSAEEEEGS